MRQNISSRHRKELASKIGRVIKQDTKVLPEDMQKILADDLVTAFFNRLKVLTQEKTDQANLDLTMQLSNETVEIIHGHPRQS
ncbi:MAG: hypothetical protein ABSB89_08800 [Candidatus Bathyarchaeia archaeon]